MLADPRAALAALGVLGHSECLHVHAPEPCKPRAGWQSSCSAIGMTDALDREERDAAIARVRSIRALRELARGCRACELWARATQTVFGDGSPNARLLIVGEQPGNSEDLEGAPFVGPAGRLLDQALVEAGIDRDEVYVTNVVKHFKWRRAPSGKRRIHAKPDRAEIEACYPWLQAEVGRVGPELIVCLGATAAQAVLGKAFRVTRQHGEVLPSDLGPALGTIHPSAVLRAPDDARAGMRAQLVADLQVAAAGLG
jgi:DNA polymerase